MPPYPDHLDEQTIQGYTKALALGQRAFGGPDRQAKPLPHIFGSAAYIQDAHAGLGFLQPDQDTTTDVADTQPLISQQGTHRHNSSAGASGQTRKSATASNMPEQTEIAYQPQNFKAMLEAALQGKFVDSSGLQAQSEIADISQYQGSGSAHVGSVADATASNADNLALHDSKQHIEDGAMSTDLPHVLAWLEKGRSLFDEDED